MTSKKLNAQMLDTILNKMLETVNDSKHEIFRIGEQSRKEFARAIQELEEIKREVAVMIVKTDDLELKYRLARQHLAEVSKHFNTYTEVSVREAYEKANELQIKLSITRQKEQQLREKRDDLERRLQSLQETIARSETLVTQISVVLSYLTGDLKQLSDMIEDAKQKQEFGLKIIQAQEDERRRLSREIHDGPAQMIANVLMRSELVDRIYKEVGIEAAMKELHDMRKMTRAALSEVRRIIYDLRPMALDDLGLIPTTIKYLKNVEEYTKIKVTFKHFGKEVRLPSKLEVALFRLMQEAVQNAVKHADPFAISVKIEINREFVNVVIKDDGKGFDPSMQKEQSFGIIGMKERVELLEGNILITSKPNCGTVISIQIPLKEEDS